MARIQKTTAILLGLLGVALSAPGQILRHQLLCEEDSTLPAAFCPDRRARDHLVTGGPLSAVLGGTSRTVLSFNNYPVADALGTLIGLVPAREGLKSRICIGAPYIKIRDKQEYAPYTSLKPVESGAEGETLLLQAEGNFEGPRGESARIVTTYCFFAEQAGIDLESVITNSGQETIERFSYDLRSDTGTRFTFSPINAKVFPAGRFRISVKPGHTLAWIDRSPFGEKQPGALAPGEARRVAYTLLVDTDLHGLLRQVYARMENESHPVELRFDDPPSHPAEVIIQEAVGGSIYYRNLFSGGKLEGIPLPAGTYTAEVHGYPGVVSTTFAVASGRENLCKLTNPPLGRVRVRIRDRAGRPVPGRVTFLGLEGTPSPHFRPDNPIESGRSWETQKNSLFPALGDAEAPLPVGTYLAMASRGPEYGRDRRVVEILTGDHRQLDFMIDRVVDSSGWISVDPHMHTTFSDGNMRVPARVLSAAAEGLDVAISADHNLIVDYGPALRELGLDGILGFILGNEVTISGMIHYNSYPLTTRPGTPGNGAIDPLSDTIRELFDRSRSADPEALIQVNHPRSGTLGYFNMFELDPESAAFALKGFDLRFDVLEIYNGPFNHSGNAASVKDWLHLINRGRFFPLVGSSDSHRIDGGEPGYARTYVRYSGGEGRDLDKAAVIQAIKAGRSYATNGPLVEITVNGRAGMGETCTDRDGTVELRIRIQSAPWVAADEARLIVNGRVRAGFPVSRGRGGAVDTIRTQPLALSRDSALVVEVLGRRTLFPVMQHKAAGGRLNEAVLPYAITNPVFVDTDGNGRFDPPLPGEIRRLDRIPKKKIEEATRD